MANKSVPEWRSESRDAIRYTLKARWLRVKPAALTTSQQITASLIDSILDAEESSWNEVNLVEILLVDYYPDAALDQLTENRLEEVRRRSISDNVALFSRFNAIRTSPGPVSAEVRRAYLVDLIVVIQHYNLRSAQIRRMRANAIRLVSLTAGVAMLLAVLPLLAALIHHNAPGSRLDGVIVATINNFPNYGLYTTVTFGMLGALFSRFVSLQTNYVGIPIDDADVFYRYENIILRVFLGTLAAVIVYFFASSGLLAGEIVPKVPELGFQMVQSADGKTDLFNVIGDSTAHAIVPTKNFALLVIWAFIAGFSEQLVPDLLTATTTRIGTSRTPANTAVAPPLVPPSTPPVAGTDIGPGPGGPSSRADQSPVSAQQESDAGSEKVHASRQPDVSGAPANDSEQEVGVAAATGHEPEGTQPAAEGLGGTATRPAS